EHDLRRKHPYLDYQKYDFEVAIGTAGDCYDRYLVRVEEMRQSARILRQVIAKLPAGPINVVDWKHMPPPKSRVMTKMEELIRHLRPRTDLRVRVFRLQFLEDADEGECGRGRRRNVEEAGGIHSRTSDDDRHEGLRSLEEDDLHLRPGKRIRDGSFQGRQGAV